MNISIYVGEGGLNEATLRAALSCAASIESQKLMFLREKHNAEILYKEGFLTKNDIVWVPGAGPLGAEAFAYSLYSGLSIGIDPELPANGKEGNCQYIKKPIEAVIRDTSVPRPTFLLSNKVSGIQPALGDILSMETAPTCTIRPCDCDVCRDEFYGENFPVSNYFRTNYSGATYLDICKENPAEVDVLDMAELGKESGYRTAIFGVPQEGGTEYMVTITKNEALINFLKGTCGEFLISKD